MSCLCNQKVAQKWEPSQDQIDATAPGGHDGYYPGKHCIMPEVCRHITSYNDMKNRPTINNVMVEGSRTCKDYKLQCAMRPISTDLINTLFNIYN